METRPSSRVHAAGPRLVRVLGRFQDAGERFFFQQLDAADDAELEVGALAVDEGGVFFEIDARVAAGSDFERLGIDQCGGVPVLESIRHGCGREKQGVLSAFGAKPEAFLAAEDVDVPRQAGALGWRKYAGFDIGAMDPPHARSGFSGGAGRHDTPLPCRGHCDARAFVVVKQVDGGVGFEEFKIVVK